MLSVGTDNGIRPSNPVASRAATLRRLPATSFVEFTIGDITRDTTDAIVNPAGPGLVDLAATPASSGDCLFPRGCAFARTSRRSTLGSRAVRAAQ